MVKATFISQTYIHGRYKDRWECPICRANAHNTPECRFNLSKDKRGKIHKCRFCGTELELRSGVI